MDNFINCVKNNPCLYDVDHHNFNHTNLKALIWANVAADSNLPTGTIASTLWETLKTQFVKTLIQRNMSDWTDWHYYRQMEFLLPYITDQDVYLNLNEEDQIPDNANSQSQDLYMFFLSMCEMTKKLPKYAQLQVKKKVFQAVIEAETIFAIDQDENLIDEFYDDMSPFLN
ncbi:hypothetical protein FQR65_LT07294 [Abscondita terminalis]|nr:hypothetical protein FQR65_LT07294 [Abscondita terminalis]